MSEIDVDAYCERIGYRGPRRATIETLRALHLLHPLAIPFENLNPWLGLPVSLASEALADKLIKRRRGGYCFEHNLLLADVLQSIGFEVHYRAARVLWGRAPGMLAPRSHMLLLVTVRGTEYVVDVGFGGLTLTTPLVLDTRDEQATPHEPFRIVAADGYHVIEGRIGGTWRPLYRFDDQPQYPVDYEVSNWFVSTHPQSPFVTGLMLARPAVDRRYAMRDNHLSIHHLDGRSEQRLIGTANELRATFSNVFDLAIPDTSDADAALARIVAEAAG